MNESYEETAFRFLSDLYKGDDALINGWRRNADQRWLLTLQLCKSYHDEVEKARKR